MIGVWDMALLFGAAFLGGAVNSVAGGGTLLTFPALLWAHQLEIVANATSTVALCTGALSSFWGYRKELESSWREIFVLAVPSFVGGVLGAVLLTRTDNATFAALVPWLILLATLLFLAQRPLSSGSAAARRGSMERQPGRPPRPRPGRAAGWPCSPSSSWSAFTAVTSARESGS